MTATQTDGQQFTQTLRKISQIGPRTRQHRDYPGSRKSDGYTTQQDVIRWALDTVTWAVCDGAYSNHENDLLRLGWGAVCSWHKHVEGYRLDASQHAYLTSLSPWEFTALLGEMVDAGIANVGEGERWFEERRAQAIAAWRNCLDERIAC